MKDLPEYWIEVNRLENQGDKTYRRILARLFSGEYEALEVLMQVRNEDRARAVQCLATAIAYEAGNEPLEGQTAANTGFMEIH